MINLLAISASPIEGSSTEILVKQIASVVQYSVKNDDVNIDFINLQHTVIKPCIACGYSPEPDFCIFDDVQDLYDKLINCDALIFGSPVYFDSVSAQAKLFIDRCNCFRPPDYENKNPEHLFIKRELTKRPGVMVIVGGEDTWFEGARRVIAGFFKWVEVSDEGLVTYGSPDYTLKGSVAGNKEKINEAELLGQKLAAIIKEKR